MNQLMGVSHIELECPLWSKTHALGVAQMEVEGLEDDVRWRFRILFQQEMTFISPRPIKG